MRFVAIYQHPQGFGYREYYADSWERAYTWWVAAFQPPGAKLRLLAECDGTDSTLRGEDATVKLRRV